MDASELTDLISRTALGDRAAFARLYRHTGPKLFGVCLRILRDRPDAEEALQEVYVKVWQNANRFAARETSPLAWLAAIARNHSIDRVRARKPAARDIDDVPDIVDARPDPEAEAISLGEQGRIDECMDELENDRAAAVRSAYIEGYSYKELADRFDVPLNTMRTWLRRSLIRLRECLER